MVALEEVSDLALAELRVAKLASRSGPAEDELVPLVGTVGSTFVGVKQLLKAVKGYKLFKPYNPYV